MTPLKPGLSCGNNLALSWFDKVTAGTYNFVSVIANIAF